MVQDRRTFIKSAGKISVGVGCLGGVLSMESCIANYLVTSVETNGQISVDKTVFVNEETGELRPFVTVRSQRFSEAIYLSGLENEDYEAILLHCTHKGCEVRPVGDLLICPCHRSEFDRMGKVIKSPAEKDLARFQVSHDQDSVFIHLN